MRRPAVVIISSAAVLATGLSLLSQPAQSRDSEATPEATEDSGRDKIQDGLSTLLEGFSDELAPRLQALRELSEQAGPALQSFIEEMGPALTGVMTRVQDWSDYELPEIQPNGDILIRRKPEADPLPPVDEGAADGEGIDI